MSPRVFDQRAKMPVKAANQFRMQRERRVGFNNGAPAVSCRRSKPVGAGREVALPTRVPNERGH